MSSILALYSFLSFLTFLNLTMLLKCYFFHKSKVLMFNTYHSKLQAFMFMRSVINWAIISGFGRPPLQNSNMAGNNWESWGGREVTSSNQDSKNNLATLVWGKWVPERFLQCFLRIRSKFELNSSVHDKSMPASRCVVQDCNNGSSPREGISFHNSPPSGIVLSSWKRFVSSHHKYFNPGLPGFIISEDPWNALYRVQFPQHGRKKMKTIYFLVIVAL